MGFRWPLGLTLLVILAGCADAPTIPQVNPLPEGRLSSDFGPRAIDPVSGEAKPSGHHNGYDLAAAMGTPIRASKSGKVAFAGRRGGYGNAVVLEHPGGWSTLYGHASRLAVEEGQEVNAGQVVAYVGSTGHSTGPHLHYELRYQGKPVDPGLFTAAAPAARPAKPRKAQALAATPKDPPAVSDTYAALERIPDDAPPLRYPEDPGMKSAMQALDGSAVAPDLLAPSEPPTRWQRLKGWLAGLFQKVTAKIASKPSS